jgi:hypothetical protein
MFSLCEAKQNGVMRLRRAGKLYIAGMLSIENLWECA